MRKVFTGILITLIVTVVSGCAADSGSPDGFDVDMHGPTRLALIAPKNLPIRVSMMVHGTVVELHRFSGHVHEPAGEGMLYDLTIPPVGDRLLISVGEPLPPRDNEGRP